MNVLWIIIGAFILFELFFFFYGKKRKKLPKHVRQKIQKHLHEISHLSEREQIIEYDKLLDYCLKQRGFSGTLGEKMKRFGKSFQNENAIWQAHKLRNKIAHEVGYQVHPKEFANAKKAFLTEISAFLKS